MSAEACSRAWQAEAREDGRLSKQDAASFERHAATCAVCTREIEALAQLKATAAGLPVLTSTPLEHHRLRQELLRRAHEASTQAPRAPKGAWVMAGAVALLLVVAGGAFVFYERAPSNEGAVAAPYVPVAPTYEAHASPDAVWHTQQPGPVLRLALERGQLELSVAKLQKDQRFIVQLPDGELEVKGTRFVVEADGERTTAVRVIEGRVVLRLGARPEELLTAGGKYEAQAPSHTEIPQAREKRTKTSVASKPSHTKAPAEAAPPKAPASPDRPAVEAPVSTKPTETTFARAMSAFEAGDFGLADTLFKQFEHEHPSDSRIEDALFLRALARSRRGDQVGARALALDYLTRFPNGLRKADAERLSR